MNSGVQIPKVLFEILPVVVPRHAVGARSGLRVQRPIGRPQAVEVDVVQERREPHILVLPCDSAHAIQRTWRTHSGTVSGARLPAAFPLPRPLPSTASAPARAALFGGFAGTTDPS